MALTEVDLQPPVKEPVERLSKREINRRRREEHRLLTREAWLEQKKLKRKQKQQKKRDLLKALPDAAKSESEKIVFEQKEPSIVVIFDMSFDDYMKPKV
jgi:hypothetical protein